MSVPRPHHSFVATLAGGAYDEHALLDGRGEPARRTMRPEWLQAGTSAMGSVRAGVGRVLHWLARALYVSPILVIVKAALRGTGDSDLVTVGFVCLVLLFFTVLDFYLLVSFVWWLARRRAERLRLVLPDRGDAETGRGGVVPTASAAPGDRIVARGRIVAMGTKGEDVLRDVWIVGGIQPTRAVEVADFAVVAAGEPTVVVRCETAPAVIAPTEGMRASRWLDDASPATRDLADRAGAAFEGTATVMTLRDGDPVEVIGRVQKTIANPVVGADADSPYRRAGAEMALLVVALPGAPHLKIVRT